MAKYKKGVLGGYSGTIKGITGYRRGGKDIIQKSVTVTDGERRSVQMYRALAAKEYELLVTFLGATMKDRFYSNFDSVLNKKKAILGYMYSSMVYHNARTWSNIGVQGLYLDRCFTEVVESNFGYGYVRFRINKWSENDIKRNNDTMRVWVLGKNGSIYATVNIFPVVIGQVYNITLPVQYRGVPSVLQFGACRNTSLGNFVRYISDWSNQTFKPSLLV